MSSLGKLYGYRIGGESEEKPKVTPKSLFLGFVENTSSHAIGNLISAKGCIKVTLWIVVLLCALSACSFHIYRILGGFLSYTVSTEVHVDEQKKMLFPAVTICNNNRIRRSRVQGTIYGLINNATNQSDRFSVDDRQLLDSEITVELAEMNNTEKHALGHQLSDLVVSCYFSTDDCDLEKDFTHFFNAYHGNCYTFNSVREPEENLRYAHRSGFDYGLRLTLNLEHNEIIQHLVETAGIMIVVHNLTDMPIPEENGILLQSGRLHSVVIRKTEFNKLGGNYGRCLYKESNEMPNAYSKYYGAKYSRDACLDTCVQKHTIKICGCYAPDTPYQPDLFWDVPPIDHPCDYRRGNEMNCSQEVWHKYARGKIDCEDCVDACHEIFYDAQVTSVEWPLRIYKDDLVSDLERYYPSTYNSLGGKNMSLETIRENLLDVAIYFDRLSVMKVEESPKYDDYQFASDIGSAFGLWIGWSFLTSVEIFEFFCDIFLLCFSKCCRQKEKQKLAVDGLSSMGAKESGL